ncbi:hypothetical protein Syun_005276 [Stephania yunnanensis]|uniref:HTH myb-type domain-containing protein n=1 Tax=Stephania yunnanensis TaxID=152371 RepID=A0AAP0L847_9MAGN
MGLASPDLRLDLQGNFVPKTIDVLLGEVSMMGSDSGKQSKLGEYIERLEEEMKKIDAFKRELPLCMLLIRDAIAALREEAMQRGKSTPVTEEFLHVIRDSDDENVVVEKEMSGGDDDGDVRENKKDWLSSVQLWSSNNGCNSSSNNNNNKHKPGEIKDVCCYKLFFCSSIIFSGLRSNSLNYSISSARVVQSVEKEEPCKYKNSGGAFVPFKGIPGFPQTPKIVKDREHNRHNQHHQSSTGLALMSPEMKTMSSAGPSSYFINSKSSKGVSSSVTTFNQLSMQNSSPQQPQRKQRRCWSPELHRLFVNSLQQLGGCHVATPKQIRELMKVEGLTNDEVKSHLQKYRLHTRRVPSTGSGTTGSPVMVLEGVWLPSKDQKPSTSNSQSGSPQGPLQMSGTGGGISTTGGDDSSMEDDGDDQDRRSESYSWKGYLYKPCENDACMNV